MARARILKPGFFRNERLAEEPFETRLTFAGLWGLADREGRLEDRPRRLSADIFPFDRVDMAAMLDALQAGGFIRRYVVDGVPFIDIPKFLDHQRPHVREAASIIPAPTEADPRHDLGSDEAPPRSPGTDPGTVTGLTVTGRSVSVPVPKTGRGRKETGTGERAPRARSKPCNDKRLIETARELVRSYPQTNPDYLIDHLQNEARRQFGVQLKRQEAEAYITQGQHQ